MMEILSNRDSEASRPVCWQCASSGKGHFWQGTLRPQPQREVLPGMWLEFARRDLQQLEAI